jgi:hypothetical protein
MNAAFSSAVQLAASNSQAQGPGYLRWVLIICIVGVVFLGWLLLHNYKK